MTESTMVSQVVSTTMIETTNVATSSMFATSLEAHLCGGSSILPSYQLLSGTFSGAASSPWTSPMSSTSGIPSGNSLMSVTYSSPYPPPTPTIEQRVGPYVSGYGHLHHSYPP